MASRRKAWIALASAITIALLLSGCGGSGGGGPVRDARGPQPQATGSISVTVKFPQPEPGAVDAADLPNATKSVVLWVYEATTNSTACKAAGTGVVIPPDTRTPLVPPVVVRRQAGQSVVQATVENVPAGDVLLVVEAYDVQDPLVETSGAAGSRERPLHPVHTAFRIGGPGVPAIAEAQTVVTVRPGQVTQVNVVTNRLATSVRITGPTQVYVPRDATYTATAYDADGNVIMGTLTATFSSTDSSVLSVSADGQATARAPGQVTVRCSATWNNRRQFSAGLDVTVLWPPPARVEVTVTDHDPTAPNHGVIDQGDKTALNAVVYDDLGNAVPGYPVTWQSSDVRVAEVDRSGWVSGESVGIAVITATASDGTTTKSASAEIIVMPSDDELLMRIVDAQDTTGAFIEDEGGSRLLDLLFSRHVDAYIRVLGGCNKAMRHGFDPDLLHRYVDGLYDSGSGLYAGVPGGWPDLWPTAGAARTYKLLHDCMPAFTRTDALSALQDWAGRLSGRVDCWGVGEVVTALCSFYGPTWPRADSSIAATAIKNSANADGSYHIGEVLHTYWALAGLDALGQGPVNAAATAQFLRDSQTSAGYFAKAPGRTDWDWLHEPAAVAGLYICGAEPADPWAAQKWLARAYAAGDYSSNGSTLALAEMALMKKLLAHDPVAIAVWVHHTYD